MNLSFGVQIEPQFGFTKEKIEEILLEWKNRLQKLITDRNSFNDKFPRLNLDLIEDLRNAEFYRIKISHNGVKKL